jgi:hypothetical protein
MRALRTVWLSALALGSFFITRGSLDYFGADLPEFVIEKLPLPWEQVWLGALKVHVVAAALALPGCLLLMSRTVLVRAPRLHRWAGRVTAAVVLLALVPSGAYLALFAKGGAWSTLGFLASGAIVAASMILAIRDARARRFAAHRRQVLHVLAQLSVAVTSRAMLVGFDAVAFDPGRAYLIALWLPVAASAIAVELISRRNHVVANRAVRFPARLGPASV